MVNGILASNFAFSSSICLTLALIHYLTVASNFA